MSQLTYQTQYDHILLTTEEKPTDMPDGSTLITVDAETKKVADSYIAYRGEWYKC